MAVAACTVAPSSPTAQPPMGAFGLFDNDVGASNLASWAFGSPTRTRNDPVGAARASAAIDFLAGELHSDPRWIAVSPLTKQDMLQARIDVRRVLGIAPDAPSQTVVNALLRFATAWAAGDQPAAMQALAAPGFTLPPQQALQVLSDLPRIQSANFSSMDVPNQMLAGDFR